MGVLLRRRTARRTPPSIPHQRTAETTDGLFRGSGAGRVPALLGALVLGIVAPLGTAQPAQQALIAETSGSTSVEPADAPTGPPAAAPGPAPVAARPFVLTDLPSTGPEDRRIALTFDDGPDPTWTPKILAILARYGAKGTFCMVGSAMERHPAIVTEVLAAGMRVCAHSRTHDEHLAKRAPATIASEVGDVARRLPGTPVSYFRAPGGNWGQELLDVSVAGGMQPLGWSVDPQDWRRQGADTIVAAVQKQIHPGAVILMHDGGGTRAQTVAALERLMPWLQAQGYTTDFP